MEITRTARVRGTREILSFICYICYLCLGQTVSFGICARGKTVAFFKEIKEHECKITTFFVKIQIFSNFFVYFCTMIMELRS